MPPTKASRKRQARLAFTPLSSSSPAAKDYNQQIQDRAAAVTLEESPVKRRKTRPTTSDAEVELIIPTPEASIDHDDGDSDEDDAPPRSAQRRASKPQSRSRPRQQRLDFSNARDADSFDPPVKLPSSSARTRSSTKPGMFSSQMQSHLDSSDDDSDASQDLPSASKLLKDSKKAQQLEEHNEIMVQSNTPGQPQNVESDDDDDDMPVSTQRRRQRRAGKSSSPIEVDSEDDDGMPTTAGKQQRQRGRKRRTSLSSFIADSPPQAIGSDSDDLQIIPDPTSKRRRHRRDGTDEEKESGSEQASETPSNSKKKKEVSERERQELADDLDDLASSSADDEPQRAPRSTQSAKKNAQQMALDRLKRMRSSQPTQAEVDYQPGDETEGQDQEDNELYDDSDDNNEPEYTNSRQIFRENDEDAAFIEEDDEDDDSILGVPADLPLEFTRYASMKGKELFKHAVEWMVSKIINPGFRSDDPLYRLAFRKLDDEVRGLAGSKFTSSAWTPEFTIALQARPEIAVEEIDRGSAEHAFRDKCDACNRSGHPATFEIQFQGKPYNRDTLEEVSHEGEDGHDEDDSESSTASERAVDKRELPDWDDQGREIRPETTSWYVGRFCKENAVTASSLQHWRYHLAQAVDLYLSRTGYRKQEEVVRRDRWNTKKRQKYANKIVDRMESEGEVKKLWLLYRDAASEARSSKQGRYTGGRH